MDSLRTVEITMEGRSQVSRMEIVDSGRRQRFSDEAKVAIVAESCAAPRQVTATARLHGITRFQLNDWRKAARVGRLGADNGVERFVPALLISEPAATVAGNSDELTKRSFSRMEVLSANGRRVVVDRDVDVEALLRIVQALETLR